MQATTLGAGLGLKAQHLDAALGCVEPGLWFELHAENHMTDGGPRLAWLLTLAERHPVSLHGVSASLAGSAPLSTEHLARLAALVRRVRPALVSEHLAWSGANGSYLPDLLPIRRTRESLLRISSRIAQLQDVLGRRIALENPSHYLRLDGHDWDEVDFLHELARRSGCGLLVDVNNVFVSAHNLGFEPQRYLERIAGESIMEIHLAGHSRDVTPGGALLIDSHDAPVASEVWQLYEDLIGRIGPRPTLIERDEQVPGFDELLRERGRAQETLLGVVSEPA